MRSFTLSIFATLAFAVFSFAAPMIGGSPVNAIAARHDEHSKDVSLEIALKLAIDVITPITEELTCLKAEEATVANITPILARLKIAIEASIVDVKALASLPLERILCTLVGDVLNAVGIAKLLACLLNLVFCAIIHLLEIVIASVKAEILHLLVEIGCLIGSLVCAVLGLVSNLVLSIILCLVPQILAIIPCIKLLNIEILIKVLSL